jgi:hypothetical protein
MPLGGRWALLVFVVRQNFGELSASFLNLKHRALCHRTYCINPRQRISPRQVTRRGPSLTSGWAEPRFLTDST